MRHVKNFAALLLSLCMALFLAAPVSAEGFVFNWDMDDGNTQPHCKSLFLLNLDTDTVVYALNPDEPLPMASMTKIMSYIVAYETIPVLETTLITEPQSVEDELADTGSSRAVMAPGESFTGKDLLYMMMVPSGNNAALTLAKYVDKLYAEGKLAVKPPVGQPAPDPEVTLDPEVSELGTNYDGISYFVQLMNEKAAALGCSNTHFTNPHGLHNKNHFSSARDMAAITQYAMTLPNFTEITGTTAWRYTVQNTGEERVANTTNLMLTNFLDSYGMTYYYRYATGVKTGSLDEAGHCIASTATAYGYTYIAVAMGDMEGYENGIHYEMMDCASLFRWALTRLEKKTIAMQGDILSSVGLKYAWQKDELQLVASENVAVMLPASVDSTSILILPNVPDAVEAPIRKGEEIGTAAMTYAGEIIATVPLVAAESVERSEVIHVLERGQSVFSSPWFQVIMAVIAALIIVYVILIILYRRKQKQLRRVKRFRDM